ncbi:hypothetical protein FRC04_005840 [Tulasnella sp. 424]|nr:hypothetical protein FRC04_005840 [Tulasnella sp. 424]KAG8975985.1 hypothetical protein FRC05_004615 [Tulasnella sp. 425]
MYSRPIAIIAAFLAITASATPAPIGKRCTGTISSLADVAAAIQCTTININSFTVDAGKTFLLNLASGTTVNVLGDVTFGVSNWAGPLFQIAGSNIKFNGNGHTFNGQGPSYWDGLGGTGTTKPKFLRVTMTGTFTNLKVLNSPINTFSVGTDGPLTISKVTIDDWRFMKSETPAALGDQPNSNSAGKAAGHNTDGFDVGSHNLLITDCVVMNQDDCLAVNKGTNITFQNNKCSGGHGISIGSISSDAVVNGVYITGNTVTDSDNGLRIKTKADATGATVSGIHYTGNTVNTIHKYGVLIDQSYPSTLGTPGTGVIVTDVQFISGNTVSVDSSATRVAVNCGSGSCTGTWNWAGLTATGGKTGTINYSGIINYP